MKTRICFLCEKKGKGFTVGICFGMEGRDYFFCLDCLEKTTALEIFKRTFEALGHTWPPRERKGWKGPLGSKE